MKIAKGIRDLYMQCAERFERLSQEVREQLKPRVEEKDWFFLARVKGLESFALKIETGRVQDPTKLEDFFACTVVVPTLSDIENAEALVASSYDIIERRPPEDGVTTKASSSFVFDDLRLYVARRPSASGKNEDLDGAVFEVQIKTILQHAWSVATHDLIYKSDTVSWPRERIAFQVKAMLEHAEVAISEANRLADSPGVSKKDRRSTGVLQIINDLNRIWTPERLPKDVKRLADNVFNLLSACDFGVERFPELIEAEKRRVGLLPADLSPYAFTVQALANSTDIDLQRKISRGHIRLRLLVHDGMDLPDWMGEEHPKVVRLG